MRGHVSMVKTLCQKYHCDPVAAVKVQYTANTGCSKRENCRLEAHCYAVDNWQSIN